MKTWAKWTLLTLWTVLLIFTSQYWNPFTSFPALLKYSITAIIGSAIFGVLVMVMQFFILIAVIFPLPPRADSKAKKTILRQMFSFAFKDPPINPKAPKFLDELVGNEKAKAEIREVIDMLKNREHYLQSGAEVPKGMLFIGQPGVGKTLFARAMANEADIPFYVVEGSAFSGLIYGLGVFKLKTLFRKLRNHEQAILFIDEIESMGTRRKEDRGFGAQADQNITLNTLLTEMDGFHGTRLLVIGATNNDSMLDPALMRAGRMERRIYFQPPSETEREQLFKYYVSKVQHADDIDYNEVVELTANYSPAEIASVVNEAALVSRRPGGENKVTTSAIKLALENVSVGAERTLTSGVELITPDPSIRFDDVIGIDEAKQDLAEIVDFLKRGDDMRKIGAKIPKGIMMIGPPGVGKTMLAKAIANEAGVPFYGISASYFSSFLVGEGAARIRALYSQARKNPASIVFIDEIDAVGGTMTESGNKRTTELNQILVELDGIGRSNVITLAATNVEQNLDPAFLRSGRFDRKLYVGLPDSEARKKLFAKYLSKVKLANEVDFDKLAQASFNFSGADVAACVNEAAMLAVRSGKTEVDEVELEQAAERVAATAGHKLNTSGVNMSRVPDLEVKLEDIKGMEEAKHEAAEVVALLKNSDLVAKSGLKSPKGILLYGPPGTGKTMLAKAIANEAGVAFYALSGTDFVQVYVGLGAQRVRAVYEQARRSGKPAIVFIDEIDAIGAQRSHDTRSGGGQNEVNRTLNQLLVEMDGFGKHKILTIGASNSADMLDPALMRAGRFDRVIEVPLPNMEGREAILSHYLKELKLDSSISVLDLARMTVFSAGAELANIVNEAGLIAIRNGRLEINQTDMIQAIQRVKFGLNRSQQITLEDLWETAYHESGHAIVHYYKNQLERIQTLTIVPVGEALGYTWHVSKDDRFHHSPTRDEILSKIEGLLGGLVAEKLMLNRSTVGVSNDLEKVSYLASSMVREWGMGSFKFNTERAHRSASQDTLKKIDAEIKEIVDQCMANVEQLLASKKSELTRLATALIEKETLLYPDIVAILEPEKTAEQIRHEIETLSERKLVGKRPVVDMGVFAGLIGSSGKPGKGRGESNGNGNGNGSGSSTENFAPPEDDRDH